MRESLNQLVPALVSSNLSVTEGLDHAHYVAALGYASIVYPMASPLLRMLTGDHNAVNDALREAGRIAQRIAKRKNRRLSHKELSDISKFSVSYVIDKTCRKCAGTKFEIIPGTTCLSATACKACRGDGRRPIPIKNQRIIIELISRIERIASSIDNIVCARV